MAVYFHNYKAASILHMYVITFPSSSIKLPQIGIKNQIMQISRITIISDQPRKFWAMQNCMLLTAN